ncbi:MAG: histidinol-phosphate transaminase [Myxococcota bacterium]
MSAPKKADLARRSFLQGIAAGGAAALAGCASESPLAQDTRPKGTKAAAPQSVLPKGLFGPPEGIAQLSRNENPYGPSPRVAAAVDEATRRGAYYASPAYLVSMIAERHGLSPEQVTVSHGSGEALCAVALAWGNRGAILGPELFWDTTALYAVRQGAELRRVPMTDDLDVDLAALEKAVADDVSLVHLCNPNNPTGRLIESGALHEFVRKVSPKVTVLVDEAYNELAPDPAKNTVMDLLKEGANVIVARTFSKIYGMAGMRIGYLMSTPENIETIRQHQMSWMSAPSIAAAVASYNDMEFLAQSKAKVLEAKALVSEGLAKVGLKALPSATNFMYVDVKESAEDFRKKMENSGVMIRGIYREHTRWSRVSMGRIEDVQRYVKALPKVVGA